MTTVFILCFSLFPFVLKINHLVLRLAAKLASFCQNCFPTAGVRNNSIATTASYLGSSMTVHNSQRSTIFALDVQEVRVRPLYQTTAFVLHALGAHSWVAQIRVEKAHFLLNNDKTRQRENSFLLPLSFVCLLLFFKCSKQKAFLYIFSA